MSYKAPEMAGEIRKKKKEKTSFNNIVLLLCLLRGRDSAATADNHDRETQELVFQLTKFLEQIFDIISSSCQLNTHTRKQFYGFKRENCLW